MKKNLSRQAIKSIVAKKAKQAQESIDAPKFDFGSFCFPKQENFLRSQGTRFRSAVTSRRAGKTTGLAADMIDTCLTESGAWCLYITMTRENAKRIIWHEIKRILKEYKIPNKPNNSDLSVEFENGSMIFLGGAKDANEIEKYRGWKLRKCYIDECQSFRSHILKTLIDDVITPGLRDLRGNLYLTGTPGPVKAGAFYEYTQNENFSTYHWTAFENPFMHNPPRLDLEKTLAEERLMKGIDANDPSYIRETFGLWVEDVDSLVFKFNKAVNIYDVLPEEKLIYIIGVDIGFKDADAIAVIGYSSVSKKVYLVEEVVKDRQDITALVETLESLKEEYSPIKIVMDAGGLGLKIKEQFAQRHALNVQSAEKHRKAEFIEFLNDDLRTGKLQAHKDSLFEDDCMLVQWDKESLIRNPDKPRVSTNYHSDICDAVLYAWREAKHFLNQPLEKSAPVNSDRFIQELEAKEAKDLQERASNPDYELYKSFEADIDSYDW